MAYDGTLKFDTSMDVSGFQNGTRKLDDIVKGLAVFKILEKGFQMITNSIDAAVSRYDALNRFPKILELMGYSADQSAAATKKLADGITGLPTTLDGITASTKQLVIATGSLDTGVDSALALNNAFLASGAAADEASRGTVQYIQMLSSGQVNITSWRTLQETMTYALQQTAEAFGYAGSRATQDLYAALQSGEITMEQFNAKLIELSSGVGGFAEMAKTATGGIGTAWTNLNTAVVRGVAGIIGAIDEGLSETRFKSIEDVIKSTGTAINAILKDVASVFGFVARNAETLIPVIIGIGAAVAAWKIGSVLSGVVASFQTAALSVSLYSMSVTGAITADAIQTAGLTAKEVIVGLLTGKIGLVAAAQWVWNDAMLANPVGLIIIAILALIAAITALIIWLAKGSKEYQKQKEEVKALADAQKELASSMADSESTYQSLSSDIAATTQVSSELVDQLKQIQQSTDDADTKHQRMKNTVNQLNAAVDGLNIAYDEETGAIRNINTGQEISIAQIAELVDAKMQLAQANAWQERANELIAEQVRILEELAVIEAKKQAIMENGNLTTREQEKLIKELDKTCAEYADTMTDVEERLGIVNENIAASNTEMAEAVVSDFDRMNGAIAESEEAWKEYEAQVKERVSEVVNSFKKIPTEYKQSAEEMLQILQDNKEQYARWEANMEAITRLLGPTAAEEFGKLGPAANSALEEILGSAELMDQYREIFGSKIDEITGMAVEDWTDPNFIGAPSAAIDASAQQVMDNNALNEAVTEKMEEAIAAAETVDFSEVGQSIASDISDGISGADMSGAMDGVANSIRSNSGNVTSAISDMSNSVQSVLDEMTPRAQGSTTKMMAGIVDIIVAGTGPVKFSAVGMVDLMMIAFNTMIARGASAATQMMAGMLVAMSSKAPSLYAKAKEIADKIASTIRSALGVHSPSRVMIDIFEYVMMGIYKGMDNLTGKIYRQAEGIADGLTERLTVSPDVAGGFVDRLRALSDFNRLGSVALIPQLAGAGVSGGVSYSTNLYQTITTPKPLSPAEMTREGQDMLRRSQWQLP